MDILVLNCGSSSIKYQLLSIGEENQSTLLAKGALERIGLENGFMEYKVPGRDKTIIHQNVANHEEGINLVLNTLIHIPTKVINSLEEIEAVGHRVAHGGEFFSSSVFIDDKVKQGIIDCISLAPLHNPANLEGIKSIERLMPGTAQVAVFDTAFHQTMPRSSFLYPLPYEFYEKYAIRRYGFHGTSHQYVANKACRILGLDIHQNRIITCHLGNGASITAIRNGESLDTSMGFTPNDGLMMGTRCGSIDPGIIPYLVSQEGLSLSEVNKTLNRKSGVTGISGISSDMRDLVNASKKGNERAKLALDMFAMRVKKYIGAYIALMNGVDLLIFTGGIGENNFTVRDLCLRNLEYLGILFDAEKSWDLCGKDEIISLPESRITVMTVTTDEELVIARETFDIVRNL